MAQTPCSCYITHIEIVNRFIKIWVQHDTIIAEAIERDIKNVQQALLHSSFSPASYDKVKQTDIFLARFSDGEFYRCTVENMNASNDHISVMFIDFGNTYTVGLNELKILKPEDKAKTRALDFPPQATPYILYGVVLLPGQMNERDFEWLKSLTLYTDLPYIVHEGSVRMISIMMNQNVDLSQLIVQKNFGILMPVEEQVKMFESGSNFNWIGNVQLPDVRRPPPGILTLSAHNTPGTGLAPSPQSLRQDVRKPPMQLYQHPHQKIIVPATTPTIIRRSPIQTKGFIVGETYEAYVSHVEDGPLQFFLQMKNYADSVLPILNINMNKISLQNFSTALTQGALVIGMQPQDKALKRAMVLSSGSNSCRVFYVDFGTTEELPYSHIFQLPASLGTSSVEGAAITFALLGTLEATESCKVEFRRLVLGRTVGARVASGGPIRRAELFLERKADGSWTGSVAERLAALARPQLYPRIAPPTAPTAAIVAHYESPTQVYIQLGGCDAALQPAIESAWMIAAPLTSMPLIATPVLALYEGAPYRALVMGTELERSMATVLYVDYGNSEQIGLDQMREISRELVNGWPAQAVKCSLAGAKASNRVALEESLEKLRNSNSVVTVLVKALLSGDLLSIDLIDTDGTDIVAAAQPKQNFAPVKVVKDEEVTKVFHEEMTVKLSREKLPKENASDNWQEEPQSKKDVSNLYNRPAREEKSYESGYTDKRNRYGDDRNRNNRYGEEKKKENRFNDDRFKEGHYSDDRNKENKFSDRDNKHREDNRERQFVERDNHYGEESKDRRYRSNNFSDDKSKQDRESWRRDNYDFSNRENRFNREGGKFGGREGGRFGDRDNREGGRFNDRDHRDSGRFFDKDNRGGDRDHREGGRYSDRDHSERNRFNTRDQHEGGRKDGNRRGFWNDKEHSKGYEHDDRTTTKYSSYDTKPNKKYSKDSESSHPKTEVVADAPDTTNDNEEWETSPVESVLTTPCLKQFPPWKLQCGSTQDVILSHYESPDKFYVHAVDREAELDTIRDLIDSDTLAGVRKVTRPALGASVLARFPEDGLLYRAVIIKAVDSSSFQVLYVDYGNSCSVPKDEIFYASQTLAVTPVLAALCQLSGVRANSQKWPSSAADLFHDVDSFSLKVEAVKCVDGQLIHQVSLVTDSGESLAAQLVNAEIAKYTSGKGSTVSSAAALALPENSVKSEIHLTGGELWVERAELLVGQFLRATVVSVIDNETALVQLEAVNFIAVASIPQPAALLGSIIILHVNTIGNERLTVTVYGEDGVLIGDDRSVRINPVISSPVVRSTIRASVVNVESSPDGATLYFQKTSDRPIVDALLDALFEHYENSSHLHSSSTPLDGTLVAAKSHDGNWYRAAVVSSGKGGVKVKYIDYGNCETVTEWRPLVKPFLGPELVLSAKFEVKTLRADLAAEIGDKEWTVRLARKDIGSSNNWVCDLIFDDGSRLMDHLVKKGSGEDFKENPFLEVNSVIGSSLLTGDKAAICVTHIESPGFVWAQLTHHVVTVEGIQETLQTMKFQVDVNCQVFATRYSADGLWYRAVNADPADPELVRFIDYGNTDRAMEKKELSHQMMKPRSGYAVPLLICVRPSGDSWSSEALSVVEAFVDHDELEAKVLSVTYRTVVDLCAGEKSLCATLVSAGHAVHDDQTPSPVAAYLAASKKQSSNTIPLAENSIEPDSTHVVFPPLSALPDNCTVFISHVESPTCIYIQLEADSTKIENMDDELAAAESFGEAAPLAVGQLVTSLFADDGHWYRATVLDPVSAKVHFTDYGNSATVTEIRELPPDLRAVPPLARPVSLGDDKWIPGAATALLEAAEHGVSVLTLKIISAENDKPVVVLTNSDGISLADIIRRDSGNDSIAKTEEEVKLSESQLKPVEQKPLTSCNNVTVVFTECLDKFYVQLPESEAQCEEITEILTDVTQLSVIETPKVGSLVAALSEDDSLWYRAQVINTNPLTVLFLDYGNESIPIEIRELPETVIGIPSLAYECKLKKPHGVDSWSAESEDLFFKLTSDPENCFDLTVISQNKPTEVSLLLNGVNVIDSLCVSQKETQEVVVEPVDTKCDEKKNNEVQTKGEPCFVAHINSCEDFFVQLEECGDDLQRIIKDLVNPTSLSESNWTVGQLVAARCPLDDVWYRALIISVGPPLSVNFVDFGNTIVATDVAALPENLKSIPHLATYCSLRLSENAQKLRPFVESKFAEIVANTFDAFQLVRISEPQGSQPAEVCLLLPDGTDIMDAIMNRPLGSKVNDFETAEEEPSAALVNPDTEIELSEPPSVVIADPVNEKNNLKTPENNLVKEVLHTSADSDEEDPSVKKENCKEQSITEDQDKDEESVVQETGVTSEVISRSNESSTVTGLQEDGDPESKMEITFDQPKVNNGIVDVEGPSKIELESPAVDTTLETIQETEVNTKKEIKHEGTEEPTATSHEPTINNKTIFISEESKTLEEKSESKTEVINGEDKLLTDVDKVVTNESEEMSKSIGPTVEATDNFVDGHCADSAVEPNNLVNSDLVVNPSTKEELVSKETCDDPHIHTDKIVEELRNPSLNSQLENSSHSLEGCVKENANVSDMFEDIEKSDVHAKSEGNSNKGKIVPPEEVMAKAIDGSSTDNIANTEEPLFNKNSSFEKQIAENEKASDKFEEINKSDFESKIEEPSVKEECTFIVSEEVKVIDDDHSSTDEVSGNIENLPFNKNSSPEFKEQQVENKTDIEKFVDTKIFESDSKTVKHSIKENIEEIRKITESQSKPETVDIHIEGKTHPIIEEIIERDVSLEDSLEIAKPLTSAGTLLGNHNLDHSKNESVDSKIKSDMTESNAATDGTTGSPKLFSKNIPFDKKIVSGCVQGNRIE